LDIFLEIIILKKMLNINASANKNLTLFENGKVGSLTVLAEIGSHVTVRNQFSGPAGPR